MVTKKNIPFSIFRHIDDSVAHRLTRHPVSDGPAFQANPAAMKHVPVESTGHYFHGFGSTSADQAEHARNLSAERFAEIMVDWQRNIDDCWNQCLERGISLIEPDGEMTNKLSVFNSNYLKDLPAMEMEKGKVPDPSVLIEDFVNAYNRYKKLLATIDSKDLEHLTKLIKTEIYDKIDAKTYGMYPHDYSFIALPNLNLA